MIQTFADLLSPVTPETFFADTRDRRPLHVPGDPAKFEPVMSWDDLTGLLNQAALWTGHTLQMVMDKRVLPVPEYCRPGRTRDGGQAMLADLEKVRAWVKRGASIVLNEIDTLCPGVRGVAKALEGGPGGNVQSNLYCSWKARQAFDSHFDTHDVYALHIAGSKRWRIYQRHFEAPINHPVFKNLDQQYHNAHKGPVSQEVVLNPGDLLYIPRGFYHDAIAESEATVHLACSVVPVIGLDMISAMFERAAHDALFRRAIPDPSQEDGAALARHLEALADRFGELARDKAFLDRFREAIRAHAHPRSEIRLPEDAGADR